MRNFAFGLTIGVFTGWMFHENITRVLQDAVNVAHDKIDDLETEKDTPTDTTPPTPPETQP